MHCSTKLQGGTHDEMVLLVGDSCYPSASFYYTFFSNKLEEVG